jgi:hypothetical protein
MERAAAYLEKLLVFSFCNVVPIGASLFRNNMGGMNVGTKVS